MSSCILLTTTTFYSDYIEVKLIVYEVCFLINYLLLGVIYIYTIDENHTICSTFSKFFVAKIKNLKHSIQAKMSSLTSSCQYHDCPFTGNPISKLLPVTPDEVAKLLHSSSTKSSRQDFIPTSLIKSCSSVFSELISTLANLSFCEGTFPSRFKLALVSSLIKKHGLDKEGPSNYRPISNLNNISKILERLLLARVQDHIISSTNFNPFSRHIANTIPQKLPCFLHSTIFSTQLTRACPQYLYLLT